MRQKGAQLSRLTTKLRGGFGSDQKHHAMGIKSVSMAQRMLRGDMQKPCKTGRTRRRRGGAARVT